MYSPVGHTLGMRVRNRGRASAVGEPDPARVKPNREANAPPLNDFQNVGLFEIVRRMRRNLNSGSGLRSERARSPVRGSVVTRDQRRSVVLRNGPDPTVRFTVAESIRAYRAHSSTDA